MNDRDIKSRVILFVLKHYVKILHLDECRQRVFGKQAEKRMFFFPMRYGNSGNHRCLRLAERTAMLKYSIFYPAGRLRVPGLKRAWP